MNLLFFMVAPVKLLFLHAHLIIGRTQANGRAVVSMLIDRLLVRLPQFPLWKRRSVRQRSTAELECMPINPEVVGSSPTGATLI